MDRLASEASRLRFEAYIDDLVSVIGHADRVVPLHDYCTGLLLPGERKSVEAPGLVPGGTALTDPARTAPKHQSLLHFVANAPWSDAAVLTKVRQTVLPKIEAFGAIEASIIDDTGFPKRASIRSASRGSIAASWASRTTARACPCEGARVCTHAMLEQEWSIQSK